MRPLATTQESKNMNNGDTFIEVSFSTKMTAVDSQIGLTLKSYIRSDRHGVESSNSPAGSITCDWCTAICNINRLPFYWIS